MQRPNSELVPSLFCGLLYIVAVLLAVTVCFALASCTTGRDLNVDVDLEEPDPALLEDAGNDGESSDLEQREGVAVFGGRSLHAAMAHRMMNPPQVFPVYGLIGLAPPTFPAHPTTGLRDLHQVSMPVRVSGNNAPPDLVRFDLGSGQVVTVPVVQSITNGGGIWHLWTSHGLTPNVQPGLVAVSAGRGSIWSASLDGRLP